MSNIVERLRSWWPAKSPKPTELFWQGYAEQMNVELNDAAAEIERLRAANAELVEGFVKACTDIEEELAAKRDSFDYTDESWRIYNYGVCIANKCARAALEGK